MANGGGGYLLFGITDPKSTGATGGPRIVGIPVSGELRKEFGEKIAAIEPNVHFHAAPQALALREDSSRCVFVAYVPRNSRRPHMVAGRFYRRGAGGAADAMSISEVREQMLNTEERSRRMTQLRLEIAGCAELADTWQRLGFHGTYERFEVGSFMGLVADVCPMLPNSILRDLRQIPILARSLNKAVDHFEAIPGPVDTSAIGLPHFWPDSEARRLLSSLAEVSRRCEARLAADFGPLGT